MKTKPSKNILHVIGISLVCIFSLISCSGDGIGLTESGIPLGETGFAAQIQPILDTNCVRCHAPGGLGFTQTGGSGNNGLDLTRGNSHRSLVNQPTFQNPNILPKFRVLPGNSDSSYILQKIISTSPKFGKRMPFDGPPFLSETQVQLIRNWIENGAQND
jgi:hypothetical protein